MTFCKTLFAFTLLAYVGSTLGKEMTYAQIGQAAVSGFRCATFAAHARYANEETRLLAYGLSNARIFIKAARDAKVSVKDFNESEFVLPLVMRAWSFNKLDVPIDFSAGQIYESIWEQATADLGEETRKMKTRQENYQEWGRAEYMRQNCALIGK